MSAVLDRDLSAAWLDEALKVGRRDLDSSEARRVLADALATTALGEAAAKKTITALSRIWLQPLQRGSGHLAWAREYSDKVSDWRPLHLGALLSGEPFIRDLLCACSLEHRARGNLDTVALRARMRNTYGAKRTIDVATQRGVKTLRSLGLLTGHAQASTSEAGRMTVLDGELAAWLVRCLLLGRGAESIAIEDLSHAPELFAVTLPAALPRSAAGVTKHVEGLGRTVLALDR